MSPLSRFLLTLTIGATIIATPGNQAVAAQINVFAAASLTDALREIATDYEKTTGDKLVLNLAGSSTLARQIEAGAPADVFFSADEAKMDRLDKQGLVRKETRKSLLANTLVIVVETNGGSSIASPNNLASPKVKRLALAEPRIVPAGIYAKSHLEKLGLWKDVSRKVVPTENVRGALAAVESGNVEAAIVYKTDALISKKVRIACEVPASEGPDIRYPVAVLKDSPSPEAARHLVTYLASPAATRVFQKFGFSVKP